MTLEGRKNGGLVILESMPIDKYRKAVVQPTNKVKRNRGAAIKR